MIWQMINVPLSVDLDLLHILDLDLELDLELDLDLVVKLDLELDRDIDLKNLLPLELWEQTEGGLLWLAKTSVLIFLGGRTALSNSSTNWKFKSDSGNIICIGWDASVENVIKLFFLLSHCFIKAIVIHTLDNKIYNVHIL